MDPFLKHQNRKRAWIETWIETCVCVSGSKKCLFFTKFGVFRFLVTPVLRFTFFPHCQKFISRSQTFLKTCFLKKHVHTRIIKHGLPITKHQHLFFYLTLLYMKFQSRWKSIITFITLFNYHKVYNLCMSSKLLLKIIGKSL